MSDDRRPDIETLIAQSSLGTTGARELRDRTPAADAAQARRLGELQGKVQELVSPDNDDELIPALCELALICDRIGLPNEAASHFLRLAERALAHAGASAAKAGHHQEADTWIARSQTLQRERG